MASNDGDRRSGQARGTRLRICAGLVSLPLVYAAFVLGSVHAHVLGSGLPGGRNGPADAYRHSLASAVVGYTLSPRCVDWVTAVMERGGEGGPSRAMDAHNNRIGARIGASAAGWRDMQDAVRAAVRNGGVDAADPGRITWLPPSRWRNRLY